MMTVRLLSCRISPLNHVTFILNLPPSFIAVYSSSCHFPLSHLNKQKSLVLFYPLRNQSSEYFQKSWTRKDMGFPSDVNSGKAEESENNAVDGKEMDGKGDRNAPVESLIARWQCVPGQQHAAQCRNGFYFLGT